MKKGSFFFVCFFLIQLTFAQYQIGIIPRISPDKGIYQKIGYTEIEVKYGSPAVNNRPIWGELVAYDEVWRAGANSATQISFSASVNIGNQRLDSGTYAFFIIPRKNDSWTVIFNKIAKQWGAFSHDEKEDALRVELNPRITPFKTENLTYSIHQTGFNYGRIVLAWGYLEIEVPFTTNYLREFEREVEKRAGTQPEYTKWIPYVQGAEHLIAIKSRLELAKTWINKAEALMDVSTEWNEQFYPRPYVKGHLFWTKAKILAWDNNYNEAVLYVDKLKSIENTLFYDRRNEAEEIEHLYEIWKEKSRDKK